MAEICDVVECTGALASSFPSSVIRHRVDVGASLSDQQFHTVKQLVLDGGNFVNVVAQRGYQLLVANGVLTDVVLDHVIARQLVEETLHGVTAAPVRMRQLVAETGNLVSSLLPVRLYQLVLDGGALVSELRPVTLYQFVAEAGHLTSFVPPVVRQLVAETGNLTSAAFQHARAYTLVVETGNLTSVALQRGVLRDLVGVTGALATAVFQLNHAYQLVEDEVDAETRALDNRGSAAWAAPLEGFGMSRYSIPEVESLAAFGGVLVAAGPGGVFVADGPNDNGTLVAAKIDSGLSDFKDPALKRTQYAYATGSWDGVMAVTIGETSTGVERQWDYEFMERPADANAATRAKLGEGFLTPYIRVILRNTQGCNFRIRTGSVTYLSATRKV